MTSMLILRPWPRLHPPLANMLAKVNSCGFLHNHQQSGLTTPDMLATGLKNVSEKFPCWWLARAQLVIMPLHCSERPHCETTLLHIGATTGLV